MYCQRRFANQGMNMDNTQPDNTEQNPSSAQDQERAAREAAVDRFLKRRASWEPTGMSLSEIATAHREGRRL